MRTGRLARSQDAWEGLGGNLANRKARATDRKTARVRKIAPKTFPGILRSCDLAVRGPSGSRFARLTPRPCQASCDLAILRSVAPPIRKIAPKTFPGILRSCDLAVYRPWTCQRWVLRIDPKTFPGILRSCDLAVQRHPGSRFARLLLRASKASSDLASLWWRRDGQLALRRVNPPP